MTNKIETLKSEIADLVEQLNNKKQERALNLASLEVKKEEFDNINDQLNDEIFDLEQEIEEKQEVLDDLITEADGFY